MAISDAVKAKLNKMNRAAQDAELGKVVQDLQNAVTPEIEDLLADVTTLKTDVGDLTYTEDNYIVDAEPLTTSVDKLDIALKDVFDRANSIVKGSYTCDGDDETAGAVSIDSGLASITGWIVGVIRGGVEVGGGWTPTTTDGTLTITDAAIVTGDVINYIIF